MGATVTVKCLATAMHNNGKTYYFLHEATYEKNCYPHTPRFEVVALGELADVLKAIFWMAAACEGGSLQATNGAIKPETYISRWYKALSQTQQQPNTLVDIRAHMELEGMMEYLRQKNPPIIDSIESGERQFQLHDQGVAETISLFNGFYKQLGWWRVMGSPFHIDQNWKMRQMDWANPVEPYFPYAPKKQKETGQTPLQGEFIHLFTSDNPDRMGWLDRILVRDEGGGNGWTNAGCKYEVVENAVRNAWENELCEPHSYKARIKQVRDTMELARHVHKSAVIATVPDLPNQTQGGYREKELAKVIQKHGRRFVLSALDDDELNTVLNIKNTQYEVIHHGQEPKLTAA